MAEPLLLVQFSVGLLQVTLQSLRADELPVTLAAHVQEEMFPDVSDEGFHLGGSVVTERAYEWSLWSMDQHVALTLHLVLKVTVTCGTVEEELPEALTSL